MSKEKDKGKGETLEYSLRHARILTIYRHDDRLTPNVKEMLKSPKHLRMSKIILNFAYVNENR